MQYFIDFVISFIGGLVSGYIVSKCLKKKWDKEQHINEFFRDIQIYHRYIQHVKEELCLGYKSNDYNYLIRTIENEPIRESFTNLSVQSERDVQEIQGFLREIKNYATNNDINDEKYRVFIRELFKYSVIALKLKENTPK